MSAFQGMLTKISPMRQIFPHGLVPLKSPIAELAQLGEGATAQEARVFFIAVECCTAGQKECMAEMMARMGQDMVEGARAAIAAGTPIPAREINFDGVNFPLRFVN